MLKEIKSRVISGLIVASIISLVQWVFHYPILENIWWGIKLIWNYVFRLKLELWFIITIILLRLLILRVFRNISGGNKTTEQLEYKNYTRDTIGTCVWTWEYSYNSSKNIYEISNLQPLCSKCSTPANYLFDNRYTFGYISECPRCDSTQKVKTIDKVQNVIIDNINRNNY